MQRKKNTRLLFGVLILLAAALIARFVMRSVSVSYPLETMFRKHDIDQKRSTLSGSRLEHHLMKKLQQLEVRKEDIKTHLFLEDTLREIEVYIPRGKPMEWILWSLRQAAEGTSYRLSDCIYQKRGDFYVVRFSSKKPQHVDVLLTLRMADRYYSNTAQIAFVIQNFNFQANETTTRLLSFPQPLTVCLTPAAEKTDLTAQAAHEYNKEIVINLLLEPSNKINTPFMESMIMVHYEEQKIRRIIQEGPKRIPYFAGFSNLFGSRACEDSRVMRIMLDEVKQHKAYFLEDITVRNSVVKMIARNLSVPYAQIQGHLPTDTSAGVLEEQIRHYCYIAQKKGFYIIGAHASPALLSALEDALPFFEKNGIQLVPVSTIVPKMRSN